MSTKQSSFRKKNWEDTGPSLSQLFEAYLSPRFEMRCREAVWQDTGPPLRELFKSHLSPHFEARCRQAVGIEASSLDNCERSPIPSAVQRLNERGLSGRAEVAKRLPGVSDVEDAAEILVGQDKRVEAVMGALQRDEDRRQEKVVELLRRGEATKARNLAYCLRESVQLECLRCESDDNYVPSRCDLDICSDCASAQKMEAVERYKPEVRKMENPTLLTLTTENADDFERGVDFITDAFAKFRRRTIPANGELRFETSIDPNDVRRFGYKEVDGEFVEVQGESSRRIVTPERDWTWGEWQEKLMQNERDELVRRLKVRYVKQGRNIPFTELVKGGFYAVDVKSADGEYNVHIHAVVDMAFIPQAAISHVWEDLTGAPVVDVRRIYGRSEGGVEDALMETVGYALKEPEFESVEEEVEYLLAFEGRPMVSPFGDLYGNVTSRVAYLVCSDCGRIPNGWFYKGTVDRARGNMGVVHGADSDAPPPGSDEVVPEEEIDGMTALD